MNPGGPADTVKGRLAALAALIFLSILAVFSSAILKPGARFLLPSSGWLAAPALHPGLTPVSIHPSRTVAFTADFMATASPVLLSVRSTGRLSAISFNGNLVSFPPGHSASVSLPAEVDLRNTVEVYSEYSYGPPLIRPLLPAGIKANWKSISDGVAVPAVPADDTLPYPVRQKSPSEKLLLVLPGLLPFVIAGIAAVWVYEKRLFPGLRKFLPSLAFAGMALLSSYFFFAKCLSPSELFGFDARGHLDYITHLLNDGTLPRHGDFWQAYQPPLFYVLSALIGSVWTAFAGHLSLGILKVLPWLSSCANVFLSWLIAREIFGKDSPKTLFVAGLAFLLPMNIYMSAFISNEVFSSAVSSLVLFLSFRMLAREGCGFRYCFVSGFFAGLALLSKYTFVVFLPVCALFVAWRREAADSRPVYSVFKAVLLLLTAAFVAGWFYLRTHSFTGSMFIEQMELFGVWQIPGFRTLSYFTGFGEALRQPFIGASFHSFWDLVYSTLWGDGLVGGMSILPAHYLWNMDYAGAVYLLALPMTLFAVIGWCRFAYAFAAAPSRTEGILRGFAAALLFVAFLLLLHMSMQTAKAFYVLLVVGPLCAVAAEGFCWFYGLLGHLWMRLLLGGWAGGLAGSILFAYFLVPPGTF